MMKEKNDQIKEIILSFIEKVPEKPDCNCEDVLDGAAI